MSFLELIDGKNFLSNFIKILTSEELKWTSNLFKLFSNSSGPQSPSKNQSVMDCQIKFLHECCVNQPDLKIIIIDLDDKLNCTILGQIVPLMDEHSQDDFPMILLRRVKQSAGAGSLQWRLPEFYQIPASKLIELKIQKQFLYFFNKLQYVRMKTLISNGVSVKKSRYWKFDEDGSNNGRIKKFFDLRFADAANVSTSTKKIRKKKKKLAMKAPTQNTDNETMSQSGVAGPSKNRTGDSDDDDDDEVRFRRPGWKRKRTKFERESSLSKKKKTKFDHLFSPSSDQIYKCQYFMCRQEFSSWVECDKHQNGHKCTDCGRTFQTTQVLECHRKHCAIFLMNKPTSKVYECKICYKVFITEMQCNNHTEGAHRGKVMTKIESKRAKARKRKYERRKKRREMARGQSENSTSFEQVVAEKSVFTETEEQ